MDEEAVSNKLSIDCEFLAQFVDPSMILETNWLHHKDQSI